MKIRNATLKDLDSLLKMNKEGLREYKWAHEYDYIRRAIQYGNYKVLEVNKEIVGAIRFYYESQDLWISMIVVSRKHRRKGYGAKLLRAAQKEARKHNYKIIRLDTRSSCSACKFYKHQGYEEASKGSYRGVNYSMFQKEIQ